MKRLFALLIFLCCPGISYAAGTIVAHVGDPTFVIEREHEVGYYTITFTADASGDCTIDSFVDDTSGNARGVGGYLREVRYVAGTAAATTDIYIYDRSDSLKTDLLGGEGVNISDGGAIPLRGGAFGEPDILGNLYGVIDEAGNGGTGTIIVVVGWK